MKNEVIRVFIGLMFILLLLVIVALMNVKAIAISGMIAIILVFAWIVGDVVMEVIRQKR